MSCIPCRYHILSGLVLRGRLSSAGCQLRALHINCSVFLMYLLTQLLTPTVVAWVKPGFHSNARIARNASACVRCVRCVNEKRKRLRWQPWLAASIDHSYWLALAFVAWKILRNDRLIRQLRDLRLRTFVFCLRNFLAFCLLRFLRTFYFACIFFLTPRPCVRCVRLNGNRA